VRRALVLALAALLAACGDGGREREEAPEPPSAAPATTAAAPAAPAAPPVAPAGVLTPYGFGAVKIGMTEAEAQEALGPETQGGSGATSDCHLLWVGRAPANIVYMVEGGRVTRVTAHLDSQVKTDRGVGVGNTEAEVRAAYPEGLEVTPHKYIGEPAHYLTLWTLPGKRGIRFETDAQGLVREVHAGDRTIEYVEGCS
jgi:hypothetical protein